VGQAPPSITDRLIDTAAGLRPQDKVGDERRGKKRHAYDARIVLILITPAGERSRPMLLQARDISMGGMCVVSRQMIHPGLNGALQLVRSDGRTAVVGVSVRYCRYAGRMEHYTGLQFGPLPAGLAAGDFPDGNGAPALPDRK
jgi:hypothetical protein